MRTDYLLLLIYPALTLALLLYKAKPVLTRDFTDKPLDQGQTRALQAFAAIAVILHHVTQSVTSYGEIRKGPVTLLASMGILFTSVFFFCSGYGLLYSYNNKPNYLRGFFKNRILRVLIPFWSANVLFVIVKIIMQGRFLSNVQLLRYVSGLTLVNSNGWYIIEIVVLYLAFYVFFKLFDNKDISLVLLCAFTAYLVIFAKGRGRDNSLTDVNGSWFRGEWWYNSTIVFVLGLLVARFGGALMKKITRCYIVWLLITTIGFVVIFCWEEYVRKVYGYYRESTRIGGMPAGTRTLLWQMALCLVWMCLLLLICMKVKFGNRLLDFIGSISVELFLTHKLFVDKLFLNTRMNDVVRFAVVLICSLATAVMMSYVNRGIFRLLRFAKTGQNADPTEPASLTAYKKKLEKAGRKKYVVLYVVLGIAVAGIIYATAVKSIKSYMDYKASLNQLEKAETGDEVEFGRYDTDSTVGKEKVKWIVLDKTSDVENDNSILYILTTTQAIAGGPFNQKHTETDWEHSDLRQKLNGSDFLDMFSRYDKKLLTEDETGDLISVLSVDEAQRYFADDETRKLAGSETAISAGLNVNTLSKVNQWDYKEVKLSWWWLKRDENGENNKLTKKVNRADAANHEEETPGDNPADSNNKSITAPVVSVDGIIDTEGTYVNRAGGGIRPVIHVRVISNQR